MDEINLVAKERRALAQVFRGIEEIGKVGKKECKVRNEKVMNKPTLRRKVSRSSDIV